MSINKVFEFVCDNSKCSNAMNHLYGTKLEAIARARSYGHIVVGNKCYCDITCFESKDE